MLQFICYYAECLYIEWHNNTQHNDIQYNDDYNAALSITKLGMMAECCYIECHL
jgi:hypothetical protein